MWHAYTGQLNYVGRLLRFAFRKNPLLYAALMLSVLSVFLELAAMTTLMPLAAIAGGARPGEDTIAVGLLRILHLPIDGRTLLLLFLVLFAVRVVTQFVSQTVTIYFGRRLLVQLTSLAFAVLVRQIPIKELESRTIGYYMSLAGDESSRASNLIVSMSQLVASGLLGILYFAAIVTYSRMVALGVLGFLTVTFLSLLGAFRESHRLGSLQTEQSHAANTTFVDALNGLRSIRSFSAESYAAERWYIQILNYMKTLARIDVISLGSRLAPAFLLICGVAGLALWSDLGIERADAGLPFVVTVVILLMRFFPIAGQALNLALKVFSDARAGRDVTQIVDQYRPAPTGNSPEAPAVHVDRIDVIDVDFSHLDGQPVLSRLNISLVRGRAYAIVGFSGSGKSTLLDLLLGFYSPNSGSICVNGDEYIGTDPRRRPDILLVSQETAIFTDTVGNNLRLGFDAPQSNVQRACRIAEIDEFIEKLPSGYETLLSYRGSNLSGGQKQRIGIARAVLRQPDVLLLDESTSALDADTRRKVVSNLIEEFRDRIVVFVTHDEFVTSKVDTVLDMDQINLARDRLGSAEARRA